MPESVMVDYLCAGEEPVAGYILARRLGRGGFGEVWEAVAPGGVRVALKFIRLQGPQSAPERRALEAIRDIRHPHLLDVQFAAAQGDFLVIAMPLCDRSLKDRLDECLAAGQPGVPRDELVEYFRDVARAVDYLNEPRHPVGDGGRLVGVQHRDIKPHNIFLVGGSARLADFGLAKALEGSVAEHTGGMSPHYAAPEVIRGRVSSRTDQYSLAVSYAQLRTGRLPFGQGSVHQILFAHVHGQPDLSGLPDGERAAVARALSKDPEDRWPDCRSFVRQLERTEAVDTNAGPETRPPVGLATTHAIGPAPVPTRRARPGWLATGAALAVLAPMLVVPRLRPMSASPASAPNPAPGIAAVGPGEALTNSIGMRLNLIPAGEFLMGAPDDEAGADPDEKPRHRVRIARPFYLGAYEVTQADYQRVMGPHSSEFSAEGDGRDKVERMDTEHHPVEQVSWEDAVAFCNELGRREGLRPCYGPDREPIAGGDGYRLPTEAEWEYACRAGTTTAFASGDRLSSAEANIDGTLADDWDAGVPLGRTAPVGSYPPNAFGLHDMHGNVKEWCGDWFDEGYYARSPADDPTGPPRASHRVFRGGSWFGHPRDSRSANRDRGTPGIRSFSLGFRVARSRPGP